MAHRLTSRSVFEAYWTRCRLRGSQEQGGLAPTTAGHWLATWNVGCTGPGVDEGVGPVAERLIGRDRLRASFYSFSEHLEQWFGAAAEAARFAQAEEAAAAAADDDLVAFALLVCVGLGDLIDQQQGGEHLADPVVGFGRHCLPDEQVGPAPLSPGSLTGVAPEATQPQVLPSPDGPDCALARRTPTCLFTQVRRSPRYQASRWIYNVSGNDILRVGRAVTGGRGIPLSQAHVTDLEVQALTRAINSGWVAPVGPDVDGFEADIRSFTGAGHALAVSSGTAALHLALLALGVDAGDEVVVPTLTFAATAFAVTYPGATPVFVDVDEGSWGMDPDLLDSVLAERLSQGRRVSAIIPVDLFGRPADYDRILPVAAKYDTPVLIDAAEALGATHRGRAVGTIGRAGVYSFNGNKIMTTSGGGMVVSDDEQLVAKTRYLSGQSREPFTWYEHREIGFNYRLSNILAALGRAQLARLPEMMARRHAIRGLYTEMLSDLEGVTVTPDPPWGTGNSWLTTATFDRKVRPGAARAVLGSLAAEHIEARPIWKPMHQQPVFRDRQAYRTGVADRIFEEGLCLPSGVGLSDGDIERVAAGIRAALG